MKKIFLVLALFFFAFSFSQNKNTSDYGDINARLDKMLEKREIKKKLINLNLEGKTFAFVQNKGTIVYKNIINFLTDKNISIIEFVYDTSNDSKISKFYTGDFVKSDNFISVRADVLEGKKIGFPLTYNFILQETDKVLYLINLNNNEEWIDATTNQENK